MSSTPAKVADINDARYTLTRPLGRGGQGAVFEVEGGRLAVKVLFDRSPTNRERLRNQIVMVKRLPLQDLEIARPRELLREPHLGYVMELLTGMAPLKTLLTVPKKVPSPIEWYSSTGGLRRRLRLLARAGDVLSALHGKSLVYSDPSPDNIFVSQSIDGHEVRLIDADNLHLCSTPGARAVFTPWYGAPELVLCESGPDSLTDAHAFAVVAFQTLCLTHPLIGDAVANGEPEREEEALCGKLPWIDSPRDASNRSTHGLPRRIVLSKRLQELAEKTFGEGLRARTKRPGVSAWAERLHAAADATLVCPTCRGSFYVTETACPWCDAPRPAFALALFHLWDPSLGAGGEIVTRPGGKGRVPTRMSTLAITEGETIVVTRRLTDDWHGQRGLTPVVELRLTGSQMMIRALDGREHKLMAPAGTKSAPVRETVSRLRLTPGMKSESLHLGGPNEMHRVVEFEIHPSKVTA